MTKTVFPAMIIVNPRKFFIHLMIEGAKRLRVTYMVGEAGQ